MPYINVDGRLQYVTQEQFDIYTLGQPLNSSKEPAGGNVVTVYNDTGSQKILYPNTTNTSPDQTLGQSYQQSSTSTAATNPFTPPFTDSAVKVYGDSTSTTITPGSSGITDQVKVYGDSTNTNIQPLTAEQQDVANFNSQSTPVPEQQAQTLQEVSPTVDPPLSELDKVTVAPYDDSEAANAQLNQELLDNATNSPTVSSPGQGINPYSQINTGTFTGDLFNVDPANAAASAIAAKVALARTQATVASQRKQINNQDWRVRLRLAPQARYLYNAPNPGILQPLQTTDGIIFPYTPTIDSVYKANYDPYDLTHSNYRGYFYKNSNVDQVSIKATFTAQDTTEANYLLAVITFLKAATKMFYGQDAQRGAPPPLVYLSGYGQYQFNEHPALISQFSYSLPDGVDYIRAGSVTVTGQNLTTRRDRPNSYSGTISPSVNRLITSFLTPGAIPNPFAPSTLGVDRPTYVPTKMDISLTLLPVQSRQQVSQQFSVKEFANGNLIKGGFW